MNNSRNQVQRRRHESTSSNRNGETSESKSQTQIQQILESTRQSILQIHGLPPLRSNQRIASQVGAGASNSSQQNIQAQPNYAINP